MAKYKIKNRDFTIKQGVYKKLCFKGKELVYLKNFDSVYANAYGAVVEQFVEYKKQNDEAYCYCNFYVYDKKGNLIKTLESVVGEKCYDYRINGNNITFTELFSGDKLVLEINKEHTQNENAMTM